MATFRTVTGTVLLPVDGTVPQQGVLRFALTGFDTEGTDIIAGTVFDTPVDANTGAVSVDLWTPDEGEAGLTYTVVLQHYVPALRRRDEVHLGVVTLTAGVGSVDLTALLSVPPPAPVTADVLALALAAAASAQADAADAAASAAAADGAEAAQIAAEAARDAALLSRGVFVSTAAGISNGVAAVTVTGAGTGGANGVFALAFSGGGGTGAAGTFTVSGGAIVSVTITNPGTSYTSAPTVSFAASSGLTGAAATVAIAARTPVGGYFSVPASGDDSLILYRVDAGPVAVEVARYPSSTGLAGKAALPSGAPSYSNPGGQGDRTASVTVVISPTLSVNVASNLVDGATGNNTSDSIAFSAVAVSGLSIQFDFGINAERIITEATWRQSGAQSHGTWQWQGSQDAANWINIGASFTLGGSTAQIQTTLSANQTGYRYYRLLGISGTASGGPFIQEVEFKIASALTEGLARKSSRLPGYFPSGKLLAGWLFDEGTGNTVIDVVGRNNIDLSLPTSPNAQWTRRGISLASGLVQTPVIAAARQVVILYRTGFAETSGFLISGGSGSGVGIIQEQVVPTETTRYAGSGYGWHSVAFRAGSGQAAFELNRGGWGLLSRDMGSAFNSAFGFGGRHSATTSRCATFEIAMAFVFSASLTSDEENALLAFVRQEAVKREIYIHRDDCRVREDVYVIAGESNADGRSTLPDLSSADRALRLDRNTMILPGNNSTNWRQFDGFELGFNQQITDPANDFGPEFGVAFQRRAVASTRQRNARIIKLGRGTTFLVGSALATPPGSAPSSSASWNVGELNTSGLFWVLLRQMQLGFQQMLSQGIGWDQVRFGFWIGLNDAVSTSHTTDATTYQSYLQAVLDTLKAQFPSIGLTMVLFRPHASDPSSNATALGHVRSAMAAFDSANADVIVSDTDALGLEPDSVHYNAAASKAMGITLHG